MRWAGLVGLLAPLLLLGAAAPDLPDRALFDGADPSAMVVGKEVWLYPTDRGDRLQAWSSDDLRKWKRRGDLLRLGDIGWANAGGGAHYLWAPHMVAANGRYYLYYSVGPQQPRPSRIGVAVCQTPAGPCTDSGRPLLNGADSASFAGRPSGACKDGMAPTGDGRFRFEAIDPMVFIDARSGRRLLYAGGSNGSTLRVFELAPDMVSVTREVPVDQPPCFTEGAWMHERNGIYYLSYSAGHWDRSDYSVRYAASHTPIGPWRYGGAILRGDRNFKGPGHHAFLRDPRDGSWLIAYHRWEYEMGDGPYTDRRKVALAHVDYGANGAILPITMTR